MAINVSLIDGFGTGKRAKVNGEGELSVVVHPHPPRDEGISSIPFVEYFTTSAGATDMRVNGSTTEQYFDINANATKDTYIHTVAVTIVDAGATLGKFGNLVALTNGLSFTWITQDIGETVLASSIKTNFELLRLSLGNPSYDILTNVVSTSEGVSAIIDFEKMFGLAYGLRLRAGTEDKLRFTIKDNVSALDQFDAIAYGIKI